MSNNLVNVKLLDTKKLEPNESIKLSRSEQSRLERTGSIRVKNAQCLKCKVNIMTEPPHIPLKNQRSYSIDETIERSRSFYQEIKRRRTVRDFSNRPVPREVIENCILAAGTAPNGANLQPWHFSVVENLDVKTAIRKAAEQEEEAFYNGKAPQAWLDALAPLGTDSSKPFLEIAPHLIVIFSKSHEQRTDGSRAKRAGACTHA